MGDTTRATLTSRLSMLAGIGLIAAGVVMLGIAVKELWWTDIAAGRAAAQLREDVYDEWGLTVAGTSSAEPRFLAPLFDPTFDETVVFSAESEGTAPELVATPATTVPATVATLPTEDPGAAQFDANVASQDAFALLYVPRMREHAWGTPILHGVADEQLDVGIGHFPSAPLPGENGNFSLAGHRMTHGKPFTDIDKLVAGDEVIVETRDSYYVYTLKVDRIVNPTDVWVLDDQPVPEVSGANKGIITLVTCTPKWSTKQRWIWWGELTAVHPRNDPPAALS
jgi:LPXTG-site transpeptidase (sortase) family protein